MYLHLPWEAWIATIATMRTAEAMTCKMLEVTQGRRDSKRFVASHPNGLFRTTIKLKSDYCNASYSRHDPETPPLSDNTVDM